MSNCLLSSIAQELIETFAQVTHGFSHIHNSLQTRDKEGFIYQTEKIVFPCTNTRKQHRAAGYHFNLLCLRQIN